MKIECRQIQKSYGNTPILNFSELTIDSGEFLGITGENGTGKSTLLHMIAGLDAHFGGEIFYDGQPRTRTHEQQMTLVMQKPYMLKRSVRDNLTYPLEVRHIDRAERNERALDTAARYGLTHLLSQRADRLSGGEMQKLNLARAEMIRPRLLMLDEPTANVDRAFTKIIEQHLLAYYEKEQPTILLVTHSREQARHLCRRVIQLKRGQEYAVF